MIAYKKRMGETILRELTWGTEMQELEKNTGRKRSS